MSCAENFGAVEEYKTNFITIFPINQSARPFYVSTEPSQSQRWKTFSILGFHFSVLIFADTFIRFDRVEQLWSKMPGPASILCGKACAEKKINNAGLWAYFSVLHGAENTLTTMSCTQEFPFSWKIFPATPININVKVTLKFPAKLSFVLNFVIYKLRIYEVNLTVFFLKRWKVAYFYLLHFKILNI